METISIINETSVLQDADIVPYVAAQQIQLDRDYAPVWGESAKRVQVPKGAVPAAGTWQVALLDDADQSGVLGYHELTNDGLPLGKVFVKTDMSYGLKWTVTASHEVLELMADPWCNYGVYRQIAPRKIIFWPLEIADAVEDDQLAYLINQVFMSNFVYPGYFHPAPMPGVQLDHQGVLAQVVPALMSGGYIAEFDGQSGAGWIQRFGEATKIDRSRLTRERGRLHRRMKPVAEWMRSTRKFENAAA